MEKETKRKDVASIALLGLGIAAGVAIGYVIHYLIMGIAIGCIIGIALAYFVRLKGG